MKAGKDDSNFFGNALLAAFAVALVCYLGWSIDHSSRSANISQAYASGTK